MSAPVKVMPLPEGMVSSKLKAPMSTAEVPVFVRLTSSVSPELPAAAETFCKVMTIPARAGRAGAAASSNPAAARDSHLDPDPTANKRGISILLSLGSQSGNRPIATSVHSVRSGR